jgi:hypothetical protein
MATRLRRTRRRGLFTGVVLALATAASLWFGLPLPATGALALAAGVALALGSATDPARWERGADGERATAAQLDRLSPRRWTVWHDLRVPGSCANIDHLVVGRSGVWVIDSKTTRAAVRAHWWGVRFGDRPLDTAAVRWEAEVVADRIAGQLDWPRRGVPVRPLVAVHGEALRGRPMSRRGGRSGGVKVLPAASVTDRVKRGRRRLGRSERAAVSEAVDAAFSGRGR